MFGAEKIKTMIKTQTIKARYPSSAFLLSLACTGLGQTYNGEMAKGIAFGLLRSLPLLLVPLAVLEPKPFSCICTFTTMIIASTIIALLSAGEALFRARWKREIPLKPFNSPAWYALFAFVNTALTAISVALLITLFSIEKVRDKNPGPVVGPGDCVLVVRDPFARYVRGDLVLLDNASMGRIIAIEGDRIGYSDNIFYVNDKALILGYVPDHVIRRLSSSWDDIISESGGGKRYPIRFKKSAAIVLDNIGGEVKKGHVLIASDTRVEKNFAQTVSANRVQGRIEGVLYSSNLSKIMMDSQGDLR